MYSVTPLLLFQVRYLRVRPEGTVYSLTPPPVSGALPAGAGGAPGCALFDPSTCFRCSASCRGRLGRCSMLYTLCPLLLLQVRHLQGQARKALQALYSLTPPPVSGALPAGAGPEGAPGCVLSDPSTCFRRVTCRGRPGRCCVLSDPSSRFRCATCRDRLGRGSMPVYFLTPPPVSGALPAGAGPAGVPGCVLSDPSSCFRYTTCRVRPGR